jgi:hypothetical protein
VDANYELIAKQIEKRVNNTWKNLMEEQLAKKMLIINIVQFPI